MPKTLNETRYYCLFRQFVDGNDTEEFNERICNFSHMEVGLVALTKEKDKLKAKGHKATQIKNMYPRGHGYVINETTGKQWNLLLISKSYDDLPKGEPVQ